MAHRIIGTAAHFRVGANKPDPKQGHIVNLIATDFAKRDLRRRPTLASNLQDQFKHQACRLRYLR
jgi:hypothetical protein